MPIIILLEFFLTVKFSLHKASSSFDLFMDQRFWILSYCLRMIKVVKAMQWPIRKFSQVWNFL